MTAKWHEGTFLGNENIPCLDCGGSYINVFTCQNPSNSILRIGAFYCKSHLNKSLKSGNKYLQPLLNPQHVLAKAVTKWTVKAT